MGVGTRSKPAAGKKKEDAQQPATKQLDATVPTPPQIFVLPRNISAGAHIVTIPNPATATPSRYLLCPDKGFHEFTRTAAPKRQHRSWLLAPERTGANPGNTDEVGNAGEVDNFGDNMNQDVGYVLQTPDMFVATPIDPLYLLLPSLSGNGGTSGQEYLAPTDYLAKLSESSSHIAHMLQIGALDKLEQNLANRIAAVCDCLDMGEEKMYTLSLPKLVKEIVSKVKHATAQSLPASMEDCFVKPALEVPVVSIKREESTISIATEDSVAEPDSEQASETQSQESQASGTSIATTSTAATSLSTNPMLESQSAPQEVQGLLRIRITLDFVLASYICPALRTKLEPLIRDSNISNIDFMPLDKHMEHLRLLKKDAQALRSLSDNISRKRSATEADDDDAIVKAEAKRRRKEEEENRKKNVSQGIKKLMKADTSGMKKLSSFFGSSAARK